MVSSAYGPAAVSTTFRLACYLFLRVVPVRAAKLGLPVLYFLYVLSTRLPSYTSSTANENDATNGTRSTENDDDKTSSLVPISTSERPSWLIVLLTLPGPRHLRRWGLIINTILLLFAAEFVLSPLFSDASGVVFSRVGAVYPDGAKFVVRYPHVNVSTATVRVVFRERKTSDASSGAWKDGPALHLRPENDWVDTAKLSGLWPNTQYEYKLLEDDATLPYPSKPLTFRTFPDPRLTDGTHFRFIVSSCVTPNFPYLPLHGNTIRGFDLLDNFLAAKDHADEQSSCYTTSAAEAGSTSCVDRTTTHNRTASLTKFMLFLGDFIYADVPLYFGDSQEAYRRLYRRNYHSRSFKKVYERLPIIHTYDDHEIINNFAGLGNDSTPPFPNASNAFEIYNARANYDSVDAGQYYFDFHYGDVVFFVMDTRRYRSDPTESTDVAAGTMLGDAQLTALHRWLVKVNGTSTFKFIISSVPFTSLWGHDAVTDSWAGYEQEKQSLLDVLHYVPNVIFLTGDRHEFADIELNGADDASHPVREFSASPLSMFYVPFFRTLKSRSTEVVNRTATNETGVVHKYQVAKERVIKYIAAGNYKWSSIEVDSRDAYKPTLRLEAVVDGRPAYVTEIIGLPAKYSPSTAIGVFVSQSFQDVFNMLNLQPSKWF